MKGMKGMLGMEVIEGMEKDRWAQDMVEEVVVVLVGILISTDYYDENGGRQQQLQLQLEVEGGGGSGSGGGVGKRVITDNDTTIIMTMN